MNCSQTLCFPSKRNQIVEKSLDLQMDAKHAKECLIWGTVNIFLLAILLFDIINKCPYAVSKWYYVEYTAAGILTVSVFCNFGKYLFFIFSKESVQGTKEQKNLLGFDDNDTSFMTAGKSKAPKLDNNSAPLNSSILSWHSSFNDSARSPNWSYSRTTPPRTSLSPGQNVSWNASIQNNSSLNASTLSSNASFVSPYSKYARDEIITDEKGLQHYLSQVSKIKEFGMTEPHEVSSSFNQGSMNSFWNYCNSAANLLKTSLYQLAPSNNPSSQNKQSNKEEGVSDMDGNSDLIKKISSEKLSHYVANLRRWMSITILHRLESEIKKIDSAFKNRGFSDMQIGSVGLERLKKTVDNQQFVTHYVPMLPLIVPFLEISTNQEYVVQRIKDLAKGTCIADYRWNCGSSHQGQRWDEHLPTDAAILFHLFCTYLDSQLMPLPQPGGRSFFNRYVIIGDKKTVKETVANVTNKSRCAMLCTNLLNPKFNFISDKEIHNCVYDRNNLFYVIIQFLIFMKQNHEGLLEGVNLGKSGINIMCVIED